MENLKTKGIFTLLFTLTIFLAFSFGNVFATEVNRIFNLSAYYEGNALSNEQTITVNSTSSKTINVTVNPKYTNTLKIGYVWDSDDIKIAAENTKTATITIPEFSEGTIHILKLEAIVNDNSNNYVGNSNVVVIKVYIPEKTTVTVDLKDANIIVSEGATITKTAGELLPIVTSSNKKVDQIAYNWNSTGMQVVNGAFATIKVPDYAEGSINTLVIQAVTEDDVYSAAKTYKIKIQEEIITGEILVSYNGKTLTKESTTVVSSGDKIVITGNPGKNVNRVEAETFHLKSQESKGYGWAKLKSYPGGYTEEAIEGSITIIGEPGEFIELTVKGSLINRGEIPEKVYYFKILDPTENIEPDIPTEEPDIPVEEPEKLTGSLNAKINGEKLNNNETTAVIGGEVISISGTPANNFASIKYRWDDGEEIEKYGSSVDIPILADIGKTHTLKVRGILIDGVKTSTKTYHFVVEEEDELIIESWMREDKNAEGLLVALRNDSEEEKSNKNFYELDEEVIYYVDYKNCGKDINKEVKLTLKLPLNFEVVDSAAGTISKSNKTITWTFDDGIEEGEAGTKEVVVKYKKLSKTTLDYEIVYPQANIYKESKKMDSSAVINYIYFSGSTVIEEEHEPYMFGDAGTSTFRPDDTITRAEGALVLTRIFGIRILSNNVTSKFSDLDQTYPEAQKAIIAATNLGIINGYEDGTYRPNAKMTRAEFMKIIASFIEYTSRKNGIDGLEIKEGANIKVYDNPLVKEHWAVNYVTLLTRLNMTPVSKSNQNLRLNDEITRAEVAQLVNFYSFRAPAKVNVSTKTGFIDVSRNHELFNDIVEATRDTHKYVITDDGMEREK